MPSGTVFTDFNSRIHGHYGKCYRSAELKLVYVIIPKNASTWTNIGLKKLGWEDTNFKEFDTSGYQFFSGIREPLERWITGAAQYLFRHFPDLGNGKLAAADPYYLEHILKILIHQRALDEHTVNQWSFLDDIPNCTYFKIDPGYSSKVSSWLSEKTGTEVNLNRLSYYRNSTIQDIRIAPARYFWNTQIAKLLNHNVELMDLARQSLASEYQLYNSCEFN